MKTWALQLKTEEGTFLKATHNAGFKKTLNPALMTFEEAKGQAEFYKMFGWNAQPFNTENSIEKIKNLYEEKEEQ